LRHCACYKQVQQTGNSFSDNMFFRHHGPSLGLHYPVVCANCTCIPFSRYFILHRCEIYKDKAVYQLRSKSAAARLKQERRTFHIDISDLDPNIREIGGRASVCEQEKLTINVCFFKSHLQVKESHASNQLDINVPPPLDALIAGIVHSQRVHIEQTCEKGGLLRLNVTRRSD